MLSFRRLLFVLLRLLVSQLNGREARSFTRLSSSLGCGPGYARLGALISAEEATSLADDLLRLRGLYQATERKVIKEAGSLFRRKLLDTHEKVLQFRARGTSTHAIFCDTIEYLLSKGPLSTVEMHPLVQQMHPDICDDHIDRLIDGVNFGKKWKHHVRNAQQALKRAHKIEFDGRKWHLIATS